MARVDSLFKQGGFLRESHAAQFDVRYSGPGADPHAGIVIGSQALDFIVRQIALAGEVLRAIAERRFRIDPHHAGRHGAPLRSVRCNDVQRRSGLIQCRRHARIAERVECPKLLWLRSEFDRLRTYAHRREANPSSYAAPSHREADGKAPAAIIIPLAYARGSETFGALAKRYAR